MAFRIDKSIVQGWIDNTTPGITRGSLEIMGMERPIKIRLRGNCLRDLAGTRIDFTNPKPSYQEEVVKNLKTLQRGVVSEMTASRKVKVPLLSAEQIKEMSVNPKSVPNRLKNALILEWFSIVNGHVTIQATDFDIKISTHQWELDEKGEQQQIADNAATMQRFMEIMLIASEAQAEVRETEGEADEFEWEKRLRVRDTLEEADWFLKDGQSGLKIQDYELEEISLKKRVPLVQHAILVQNIALDTIGDGLVTDGPRTELVLAVSYIYDALDEIWPLHPVALEHGYILAILKRVLEACNCAISDCNDLIEQDSKFEDLRAHIFHLRSLLIDQCQAMRDSQDAA